MYLAVEGSAKIEEINIDHPIDHPSLQAVKLAKYLPTSALPLLIINVKIHSSLARKQETIDILLLFVTTQTTSNPTLLILMTGDFNMNLLQAETQDQIVEIHDHLWHIPSFQAFTQKKDVRGRLFANDVRHLGLRSLNSLINLGVAAQPT
ncbi:hypothetical protein NDU88_002261 [Pleurodeles waltl]|uniref:Endonuclease/exonuclease/phosphatase domain-containing protein n=1 Tax=Pleurodeles waltl TaxID=8319 RepID=A0AAV7KRQ9_PLEWA|nr:hypothetical protein NDU88_002261 [Pleurodeles waltl]